MFVRSKVLTFNSFTKRRSTNHQSCLLMTTLYRFDETDQSSHDTYNSRVHFNNIINTIALHLVSLALRLGERDSTSYCYRLILLLIYDLFLATISFTFEILIFAYRKFSFLYQQMVTNKFTFYSYFPLNRQVLHQKTKHLIRHLKDKQQTISGGSFISLQQSKLEGCSEILQSRNSTDVMMVEISCGSCWGVWASLSRETYSYSLIMTGRYTGGSMGLLLAFTESLAVILYVDP